ncbi:MAG: SusD/RagB family nutrient-binding outer membrane lipoprotein, partial [Chitinophagaceae bacterium]|nr:SusD/RagB family nutrient-binding outer membrane lipoprotein [Chitinophagaceae bacterium]
MKKLFLYFIAAGLLTGMGCKKFLDVNKNVDAPDHVDAYLYLANIEQQYQGIYWDIRAIGPLTQMMGTSSYSNFANNYYNAGSDAGGEIWRMVYWNQGMNLENLINQSEAAGNWTLAGIGYAIKAFSWDLMTKVHGELPMKE